MLSPIHNSNKQFRFVQVGFLMVLLICCSTQYSQAQILQKLKDKLKEKQEQKEDELIDKAGDKLDSLGKSKNKTISGKSKSGNSEEVETPANGTEGAKLNNQLSAYRKFDFIRGQRLLFEDKFENEAIGDYPKDWISNGGGEVISFDKIEGKWLRGTNNFAHMPGYIDSLPTNFTLEFDVINEEKDNDYNTLNVFLGAGTAQDMGGMINNQNSTGFVVNFDFYHDEMKYNNWTNSDEPAKGFIALANPPTVNLPELNDYNYKKMHLAFTRQNGRLKLYLNSTKLFDLTAAFPRNLTLNNFVIQTGSDQNNKKASVDFSNIILSEGLPDMRSDFMASGKYTTSAILFETNSDKIIPTSMPVIGMIAGYLQKNADVKLKVVGYTDNTGNANNNLDLSKRRANAVLKELEDFYKIDSSRLQSDGNGAASPIDSNDTPNGRAKNRRVEFVKM